MEQQAALCDGTGTPTPAQSNTLKPAGSPDGKRDKDSLEVAQEPVDPEEGVLC